MTKNIKMLFATVHQRFLEHQAHVHREYMNLQQRAYEKTLQHFSPEKSKSQAQQKYKFKRADLTEQKINHKYQFDPAKEHWIADHCPTFTRAALPMMSIIDILGSQCAEYFPGKKLISIKEVRVAQWAIMDKPKTITIAISVIDNENAQVTLSLSDKAKNTQIAKGKVCYGDSYPQPAAAPETVTEGAKETVNPYRYLFHGPAFQVVRKLVFGKAGSSMILDSAQPLGPLGKLNQVLLDGATQGVYHEEGLSFWSNDLPDNHVCYPALVRFMNIYGETPTQGPIRCETRFMGYHYTKTFPIFRMFLIRDDVPSSHNNASSSHNNASSSRGSSAGSSLWCEFELIYAVLPMGFMGMGNVKNKHSFTNFIKNKIHTPEIHLADIIADKATLKIETMKDVRQSQWFPNLLEDIYEVQEDLDIEALTQQILIKDFFAARLQVHPAAVQIIDEQTVMQKNMPNKYNYNSHRHEGEFTVEIK